jgi:DNA topoisomerase-1
MHEQSSAVAAGLRYVDDRKPGLRRRRAGNGFTYVDAAGRRVTDAATLARIRALAIPPAYTGVWICPDPNGHLQATGRDARGRKQYRYHKRWREVRDAAKFEHLLDFARALPAIRARVEADLALPGLPRRKVLASVVRLLEATLIRVGNEEYARANGSRGLTTLHDDHVSVEGASLRFRFRGKSGVRHEIDLRDRRLAGIVKRCRDLPGQDLFAYLGDDGEIASVRSDDVNEYLREISGADVTAKDFRTWAATVSCALELSQALPRTTQRHRKAAVVEAIAHCAARLGNTPAVCRSAYVHPAVIDRFMQDGRLHLATHSRSVARGALDAGERRVMCFLERMAA